MLGFLGGAAKGAHNELDDQDKRAFALKLQNAQIEGQIQKEQQMFDYTKATPEVTASIFKDSETTAAPGQRASVAELGLLAGKQRAETMRQSKMAAGMNRGMTVADFEEASQVKTGWKSDRWMSPTELRVWNNRLQSEKPTAETLNQYKQLMSGFKLIDQLEAMRNAALDEVYNGPLKGRAANLAIAAEQGENFPKAAAYLKFAKGQLANVAHFSGEVGRLAEGDIDRAAQLVPDFKVATRTAKMLFDASREGAANNMKTSEELFPGLRRMRETEKARAGLESVTEAKRQTEAKRLSAEGFLNFKKAQKAKEDAEKEARKAKP